MAMMAQTVLAEGDDTAMYGVLLDVIVIGLRLCRNRENRRSKVGGGLTLNECWAMAKHSAYGRTE